MAAIPYDYTINRTKLEDSLDRDERVLVHMQRHAQERFVKIAELSQEHLPVDKVRNYNNFNFKNIWTGYCRH